jgi:hypothetical protein
MHKYDKIEETMKVLHIEKKDKMLDTLEINYIYKITKQGTKTNEMLTNENNPIYEFINKHGNQLKTEHPRLPSLSYHPSHLHPR